jgi:hypothetical protein
MGRDVGRFTNRRSCRRIQGCLVRRLHGMISSLRSPLVSPTQQYRCNPAEKPDLHRRPASMWRESSGGNGSSQPAAKKKSHKTRVQPNDIVVFASHAGTWKVVASVNGSKADIRRSGGFDTRIVTARVGNLTVVRRAGSPGYSY